MWGWTQVLVGLHLSRPLPCSSAYHQLMLEPVCLQVLQGSDASGVIKVREGLPYNLDHREGTTWTKQTLTTSRQHIVIRPNPPIAPNGNPSAH